MAQQNDTIKSGLNALFAGPQPVREEAREQSNESSPIIVRGHGRPRKEESINTVGPDMRTSLIVDKTIYDKMRIIAVQESMTLKDVVNSAFKLAIERYESKHGPITSEVSRTPKEELFR